MEMLVHLSLYGLDFTMVACKKRMVVLDGTMNQQVYRMALHQSLLLWARSTFHNNFVLVLDNYLPQSAPATRDFQENQDVEVMDWRSKSPDMNLIKHLWDHMVVHINDMFNPPTMAAQLQLHVSVQQEVWVAPWPVKLRTLVRMPLILSTDFKIWKFYNAAIICHRHFSFIHKIVALPCITAHCLHLPGNTHTGIATPKLVTFGV